jgi:hypothetical protein
MKHPCVLVHQYTWILVKYGAELEARAVSSRLENASGSYNPGPDGFGAPCAPYATRPPSRIRIAQKIVACRDTPLQNMQFKMVPKIILATSLHPFIGNPFAWQNHMETSAQKHAM